MKSDGYIARDSLFLLLFSLGLFAGDFTACDGTAKETQVAGQVDSGTNNASMVQVLGQVAKRMAANQYTAASLNALIDSLAVKHLITRITPGQDVSALTLIGVMVTVYQQQTRFDEVAFYFPPAVQPAIRQSDLEAVFGAVQQSPEGLSQAKETPPAIIVPSNSQYPSGLRLQIHNGVDSQGRTNIRRIQLLQTKQ